MYLIKFYLGGNEKILPLHKSSVKSFFKCFSNFCFVFVVSYNTNKIQNNELKN